MWGNDGGGSVGAGYGQGAGGTRRGHCDRHTRGNGYPGARWGCGRGWEMWYTACVSLFVSLFPPGEPTVFSCVLTATVAASRTLPPGPSTTVPETIPEADERSASRRILGWVLGRGVRRADAPAAGPPKRTPNRLLYGLDWVVARLTPCLHGAYIRTTTRRSWQPVPPG